MQADRRNVQLSYTPESCNAGNAPHMPEKLKLDTGLDRHAEPGLEHTAQHGLEAASMETDRSPTIVIMEGEGRQ